MNVDLTGNRVNEFMKQRNSTESYKSGIIGN